MINWPLMKNAISLQDKLKLIKFILTSERYTNGPVVKEFEKEWANWVGSKHALMVSSGSTANFLLLAAIKELYNFKKDTKVIVPACTWVTNVSPVIQLGFKPIFCDVNLQNFALDIEHLAEIKKAHPDVAVIFVTHLLGYSADNEEYQKLFPDALILDDVCESHGCLAPDNKKRGADSLGATFSFYFGHHMTTVEGGMINTNNDDLYDLMRMKRSHGLSRESTKKDYYANLYPDIHQQFLFATDGYNFRSTELNAVLGLSQLQKLDSNIQKRRHNFARFVEVIDRHLDKFYPVFWQAQNSNYSFPFICRNTNILKELVAKFDENKIEHRPIVSGNLLKQPFLKNYKFGTKKLTYNVDTLHNLGLYIGNSQFINEKDIEWLDEILEDIS